MTMTLFSDGTAALIVLGGTLLATVLRCGWSDCRVTLVMLGNVVGQTMSPQGRFDGERVRSRLARVLQEITRDGLLRVEPRSTSDSEFDAALHALVGQRSVAALKAVLLSARAARMAPAETAIRTLMQAAELAPVFGLAGTLISLSKLPANGVDHRAYMSAIGMAVHATLYGLMTANVLLSPLARWVERRARTEEAARQHIVDWFEYELATTYATRHEPKAPHLHPAQFAHVPDGPHAGDAYDAAQQRGERVPTS